MRPHRLTKPVRGRCVAALLALLGLSVPLACLAQGKEPPVRILFVGNSYLYTNNLPARVQAIAKTRGLKLATTLRAEPDYSLADHLRNRASISALARQRDWIILQQGPSALSASRADLLASVDVIKERVGGGSTRIALFAAWPALPNVGMSLDAERSYRLAAEAIDGCVLPVAAAWRLARETGALPALYHADALHPTRTGTQLAAMVVVRGLFGDVAAPGAQGADAAMAAVVEAAYAQEPRACRPE